jgi:hypothetical protein
MLGIWVGVTETETWCHYWKGGVGGVVNEMKFKPKIETLIYSD